jgi:hypothetical protein
MQESQGRVESESARRAPGEGPGPVIVTVHGTNDADASPQGQRWWQLGSPFTCRLVVEMERRGYRNVTIVPAQWSGANSDYERLVAARSLANLVRRLDREGRPIAILGHSHGGNVTMEALAHVRAAPRLDSVVTFGTPFFTRALKTVPMLIAAFQCLLGATMLPVMLWYLATVLPVEIGMKVELSLLFIVIAGLSAWSLWAGVRKLTHRSRAMRRVGRLVDGSRWLTIHSPRDEAMRLLETAAILSPRYVTTASATRALDAFAALVAVATTLLLFGWNWRYLTAPLTSKLAVGQFDLGTAADLTFLLLVPVVYGIVVLALRGIVRLGGGWLWGRLLSRAIHGGVIGAAYGGDGPYKLTAVSRLPPHLPTALENRIESLSLGGIDDAAVFEAARKLYDDVVASDGPDGGIGDPDLMWKRLSDALYHNAYMRDAQVVARVADHLAEGWAASKGA